jgi:hypothetical protein
LACKTTIIVKPTSQSKYENVKNVPYSPPVPCSVALARQGKALDEVSAAIPGDAERRQERRSSVAAAFCGPLQEHGYAVSFQNEIMENDKYAPWPSNQYLFLQPSKQGLNREANP